LPTKSCSRIRCDGGLIERFGVQRSAAEANRSTVFAAGPCSCARNGIAEGLHPSFTILVLPAGKLRTRRSRKSDLPAGNCRMSVTSPSRRRLLWLALASATLSLGLGRAAAASEITAPVEQLHAGLIAIMKAGKTVPFRQRYDMIAPLIGRTFDLEVILRQVIGPRWASLPPEQQAALGDAGRWWTCWPTARSAGSRPNAPKCDPCSLTGAASGFSSACDRKPPNCREVFCSSVADANGLSPTRSRSPGGLPVPA